LSWVWGPWAFPFYIATFPTTGQGRKRSCPCTVYRQILLPPIRLVLYCGLLSGVVPPFVWLYRVLYLYTRIAATVLTTCTCRLPKRWKLYTRSSFIFRGGLLVSGNLSVSEGTQYTYCNEQPQKFLVIRLYYWLLSSS
jgi:hypothetical protein